MSSPSSNATITLLFTQGLKWIPKALVWQQGDSMLPMDKVLGFPRSALEASLNCLQPLSY